MNHIDSDRNGRCDRCNARISGTVSSSVKIVYEVEPGDTVEFDRGDFNSIYRQHCSGSLRYVTFDDVSNLKSSLGTLYADYGTSREEELSAATC